MPKVPFCWQGLLTFSLGGPRFWTSLSLWTRKTCPHCGRRSSVQSWSREQDCRCSGGHCASLCCPWSPRASCHRQTSLLLAEAVRSPTPSFAEESFVLIFSCWDAHNSGWKGVCLILLKQTFRHSRAHLRWLWFSQSLVLWLCLWREHLIGIWSSEDRCWKFWKSNLWHFIAAWCSCCES